MAHLTRAFVRSLVRLCTTQIDPHPAGGNFALVVSSGGAPQVTLNNVIFGDLFLCSGQSNMQFTTSMGT